jgi:hypothetical protein
MDRLTRLNLIALAVGICLVAFMESAVAELPPGAYKELKSKASEVVKLRIVKVTSEEPEKGYLHLDCTAKVLAVTRSKSGIKKGDEIRFRSYHWTLRRPPPGPRNPPLMRKDWKGLVYLKTVEDKKDFEIAAYGESFVASK